MIQRPPFLKKGDTIGLVAPARKISREEIAVSLETFSAWGLQVKLGQHLFGACNQFSATDQQRASDFQSMLDDASVNAVTSVRGGYGCMRIIDKLDFTCFVKHPKWIIGYSDVTVFHSHLQQLGVETLHATMPFNFEKDAESTENLRRALFGEKLEYAWDGTAYDKPGKASGILVGGNLSLLNALVGSRSDMETSGKILFLEDLDEYLYHLDRMMLCLKRSGKLEQIKALIIGGMTDMKDNTVPFGKNAAEIILDAVSGYDFPVCFNFPAGHTTKNYPLFLGREALLHSGETNRFHFC